MDLDKFSRRNALQSSGFALTALFGLGTGTAAANGEDDTGKDGQNGNGSPGKNDQPFDPENTGEVISWVQRHLRGPQSDAEEKLRGLTKEQTKAVKRVTAVQRVDTAETVTVDSSDVGTQSSYPYESKTVTRQIAGYGAVGKLWQFNHEVYFEYNGADDVRNINSRAWGDTYDWSWYYKGSGGSSRDEGDSFNAFKQGTFEHCLTKLGCIGQKNPWIEIWGNYTGSVFWDYDA